MPTGRERAPGRRERAPTGSWVVILLAATLLLVVGLLVQSLLALRAHRAMIEATLGDYAGFAAENIATELDQTFTGLFLDQLGLSRSAHYAWVADSVASRQRPTGPRALSGREVPGFFTLDGRRLIVHGEELGPAIADWVASRVGSHQEIYPPPAPYAVLRGTGPLAIVYRKEELYDRTSVYGFLVDLEAFDAWYGRIVEHTSLLPRSLGDRVEPDRILAIGLHLAPDGPGIFSPNPTVSIRGPEAWAFAAKAGRLAVGVRIDEERGSALVAGGAPGGGLRLLAGLAFLTLGLLVAAAHLVRRSARLSASKEAFIANVSHDLRTPLTQIRMFAETLLLDRLPGEDDRERSLRVIKRQAEVLEDLVDNILHASDRRPPLEPRRSDVSTLASDVVESFGPLTSEGPAAGGAGGVELRMEGDRTAHVDPVAFTRILTNLLDNAIRHGPEDEPVRVRIRHRGTRVEMVVEDRGPGLGPGDRERVFERFERLGRDEDVTGAGIGLTVVRGLAERHGGGARLEGREGGGVRAVAWIEEADGRIGEGDGWMEEGGPGTVEDES